MAEKREPTMRSQRQWVRRGNPGARWGRAASVAAMGFLGTIPCTIAIISPSVAAGTDSRVYTCAALQSLVASQGFVFISSPAFGDFVVANASYCNGGSYVQLRSVPTADQPECTVNYCIPVGRAGTN
jgi:hypothetical protein